MVSEYIVDNSIYYIYNSYSTSIHLMPTFQIIDNLHISTIHKNCIFNCILTSGLNFEY